MVTNAEEDETISRREHIGTLASGAAQATLGVRDWAAARVIVLLLITLVCVALAPVPANIVGLVSLLLLALAGIRR